MTIKIKGIIDSKKRMNTVNPRDLANDLSPALQKPNSKGTIMREEKNRVKNAKEWLKVKIDRMIQSIPRFH